MFKRNRFAKFFDNPKALFTFILKKIYYNHVADLNLKKFKDFHHLSNEDTLSYILDNNKSLIRFGDGSFDIIFGFSIYFNGWRQKYDKSLARKLREIMQSKNDDILLCFVTDFILKPKKWFIERNEKTAYYSWVLSKILLPTLYRNDVTYGNSLCFYPQYNHNIDYAKLKKYFDTKDILIVASNIEKFKNVKLGKSTHFVEAPSSDAWQKYDEIKKNLLDTISSLRLQKENTLILISLAETAKVLVYEVTLLGYRAWDTGQFFDQASKEIQTLSSTANE
jgi:hypothetical protein